MVDPGGPGMHTIKMCTTTGLADLGDTDGFDAPGEDNQLYAFQLSQGTYRRKEISTGGGARTFRGLSDVDTSDAVVSRPYPFILDDNGVWHPYTDPVAGGWDLDIKIEQPYVNIGKNHKLRKLQNSGKLLASYIPRGDVVIKDTEEFGYVVGKKGKLRLHKEFDIDLPAPQSTLILDVLLGDAPDDFVDILKGLKIKWAAEDANKILRIFARPLKDIKVSLESVTYQVQRPISYDFIHIGPIEFKRLRYTHLSPPNIYLENLI